MKKELKEIKKNLKATLTGFKNAEKEYGYDLANETYYVKQALKQVNLLLLYNVVGRSEQLVCPNCKGKNIEIRHREQSFRCKDCKEGWAN